MNRLFYCILVLSGQLAYHLIPSDELAAAPTARSAHVSVHLALSSQNLTPGNTIRAGFFFQIDEDWHIYWKNPGDSGQEVRVRWQLPQGLKGEGLDWPAPRRISSPPLMSYGYMNKVVLLSRIHVPPDLEAGRMVNIKADLKWLECKDICLPGKANLSLTLPVRKNARQKKMENTWTKRFAYAEGQIPPPFRSAHLAETKGIQPNGKESLQPTFRLDSDQIELLVPFKTLAQPTDAYFFPNKTGIIRHAQPQRFIQKKNKLKISIGRDLRSPPPRQLEGILVLSFAQNSAKRDPQRIRGTTLTLELKAASESGLFSSPLEGSLLMAILFALTGGILLNLMPCVLPVLAIKVVHLLPPVQDTRSQDVELNKKNTKKKHLFMGISYSAGVCLCFVLLAFLLWALRSQGLAVGWGFQLQSPVFISCLILLFTLIALNFWGVFEVGLSFSRLASAKKPGNSYAESSVTSSFFSGCLATLVATPCTAPFMATAIGYALLQTSFLPVFSVFTALGLGMASPFLLFSVFPTLLRWLPKPGPWMLSLKQLLGFFLLATAIWLLWLLSRVSTPEHLVVTLTSMLVISLAVWIYGKWGTPIQPVGIRSLARISTLFLFLLAILPLFWEDEHKTQTNIQQKKTVDSIWHEYDPATIRDLRGKQPVFINFTADWCLSCKVNEALVFTDTNIQNQFRLKNIALFRADWTRYEPEITKALESYGRSGVPVYALLPKEDQTEPRFLPELLTKGIVLEALKEFPNMPPNMK